MRKCAVGPAAPSTSQGETVLFGQRRHCDLEEHSSHRIDFIQVRTRPKPGPRGVYAEATGDSIFTKNIELKEQRSLRTAAQQRVAGPDVQMPSQYRKLQRNFTSFQSFTSGNSHKAATKNFSQTWTVTSSLILMQLFHQTFLWNHKGSDCVLAPRSIPLSSLFTLVLSQTKWLFSKCGESEAALQQPAP